MNQVFYLVLCVLCMQTNKTVEEALHAFVSKESIDDYTCPETKQELNAHRKLTFELLPPILILHLKCFVYDKYGGPQKVLRKLNFKETLEFDKGSCFLLSYNARFLWPRQKISQLNFSLWCATDLELHLTQLDVKVKCSSFQYTKLSVLDLLITIS